jgi:drug/metabolite transporter (DMT)-like permease
LVLDCSHAENDLRTIAHAANPAQTVSQLIHRHHGMRLSNTVIGIFCMLASSAIFVLNDSFIKLASPGVPTFQLLFIRGYVACVIGAIIITLMGQWRALPGVFELRTILRGVAETGAAFCFTIALFQMPLANIFAISQTVPLLLILGAALFYGDRLRPLQIVLIILGFVGALIVAQPDFSNLSPAIIFAFASALCITARDLIGRRVPAKIPVIVVTVATSALVTLAAGLFHATSETWVMMPPLQLFFAIAAGVFIAIGQVGVVLAYRYASTTTIAPLFYSFAVWSVASGFFIFGETPSALAFTGIALIVVTGLALVRLSSR